MKNDARGNFPFLVPPGLCLAGLAWLSACLGLGILAEERVPGGFDDWKKVVSAGEAKSQLAASQGQWPITMGTFELDGEIPDEPHIRGYYATPGMRNGRNSTRRDSAVYYFGTPGQTKTIEAGLCQQLVADSGMTVFCLEFSEISKMSRYFPNPSQQRFYAYSSSGSFTAIAKAWNHIRTTLDLRSQRFYLFGYSAGGIGVQRFAEENPELCAGVVTACGHSFLESKHAPCPFLVIHTYGDSGEEEGNNLCKYLQAIGTPYVRTLLNPNWDLLKKGEMFAFHSLHQAATPLAEKFLEGVADLRAQGKSNDPLSTDDFPFAMDPLKPLFVVSTKRPNWIAAFNAIGAIPMPIPSEEFYALLLRLPPPTEVLDGEKAGVMQIARPALGSESKGLIEIWRSQAQEKAPVSTRNGRLRVELDLRFAVERGFSAVSAAIPQSLPKARQTAVSLQPPLGKSPVFVILVNPNPLDFKGAISGQKIDRLAIILDDKVDVNDYIDALDSCSKSGLLPRIFVATSSLDRYSVFMSTVLSRYKNCFEMPLLSNGSDKDIFSVHQQQLDASINYFISSQNGK